MKTSKDSHEIPKPDSKKPIGFSLTSKAVNKERTKAKPVSSLRRRSPNSFAPDRDDSSDEESKQRGQPEAILGFGEDGADGPEDKNRPLIIKRLHNRDWKAETRARRQGKNLLPPEVIAAQKHAASYDVDSVKATANSDRSVMQDNSNIEWGLNVRQRKESEKAAPSIVEIQPNLALISEKAKISADKKDKLPNIDEEALQALLQKDGTGNSIELVIPVEDTSHPQESMSEYDAYKRAVAAAPEPSNMEDYERVPVEEFGAALLRGMGWNGKKIGGMKEVKRRQNLLGLGAKELKEAEFLGAWVNKSDSKRLNNNSTKDRSPRASEYRREAEKRRERREERGGGSYQREREFEKRNYRERSRERDRNSRYA